MPTARDSSGVDIGAEIARLHHFTREAPVVEVLSLRIN